MAIDPRHANIANKDMGHLISDNREGGFRRLCGQHRGTRVAQNSIQQLAGIWLVIDDQDTQSR